jgi:Gram-negative bacterial TonB protein C-terminal
MKPAVYVLTLSLGLPFFPANARAQDMAQRRRAVELLERASRASEPPNLPNLERVDTFRVLDAASGPQEGSFSRVVIQGTGRRDEFNFGDYHVINVWTRTNLATVRSRQVPPPEITALMRVTPIDSVRFDHEDVIYAINDSSADGRATRCIEFTTTGGQRTDNNEICVDAATGAIVSERLGQEEVENSDFFSFAGALIPGTIRYSYAGRPKLEITQTMTALTNPTPNVLAAPPNSQLLTPCPTFRRAFGESMPQPKPGEGGEDTDVLVRGVIGADGHVHDAVVEQTDRPDLSPEALKIVGQWAFTPALCNGEPVATQASIVLHFQAR